MNCGHQNDDDENDDCSGAGCCKAVAYIGCSTCPKQLADFVNNVVECGVYSGQAMHNVRGVTYDALQDEYCVTHEDGSSTFTKNLLGDSNHYATFALSRNAMLATQKCPSAKELYLNRALRGGYYFSVECGVNDTLPLFIHIKECSKVVALVVRLPVGFFKADEFTLCFAEALNKAVADMYRSCFCFCVDFASHPAERLVQWRDSGLRNPAATTADAYEARAFSFVIRNKKPHRFALDFGSASQLASLLDFPAERTPFAHAQGSRAIRPILELRENSKKSLCLRDFGPNWCHRQKLRATYCANVDPCTGVTTLRQKSLNSLYCGSIDVEMVPCLAAALSNAGPDNEIEIPESLCVANNEKSDGEQCEAPCAVYLDDCDDDGSSSDEEDCTDTGCFTYLVFQLPHTDCDPAILPLCAGDVVWLRCGECAIAACVARVWRHCCDAVHYKVALHYQPKKLRAALLGDEGGDDCPTLKLRMTLEPVGFNLHLNPGRTTSFKEHDGLPRLVKSTHSAASKWLGFYSAQTKSGRTVYASDSCAQSLLDERLILIVPEINECGRTVPRYAAESEQNDALVKHYGVLNLDRVAGVYRYDNTSDSLSGACYGCGANSCQCVESSAKAAVKTLSFHLLRSDGSAYDTCGEPLVASVELCFAS